MMVAEVVPLPLPGHYTADRKRKWEVHHVDTDTLVPSFCSIGTILPPRPAHSQCRRAQRRSRMARLRATAPAARSVLDGREHGGTLSRVGNRSTPIRPSKAEIPLPLPASPYRKPSPHRMKVTSRRGIMQCRPPGDVVSIVHWCAM